MTEESHDDGMFSLFAKSSSSTERLEMTIDRQDYPVVVTRRRNAKRLTLRVRDGAVHITAPLRMPLKKAEAFIADHQDWIKSQFQKEAALITPHDSGKDAIWYRGVLTPVSIHQSPEHKGRSQVFEHDDQLLITMGDSHRLKPDHILEHWLKTEARRHIKASLDVVLPVLDQAPVPISIRDQKTRWGSCSTTRRLSFNWRLIMAPPESLHYVVVHEAVHLIHHDHSKRFWNKVAELMPDYKHHQHWLQNHQNELFIQLDRRLSGNPPLL